MSDQKKLSSTENVAPTTIQPNLMGDIESILKAQGIEMDAEALAALNQFAGKEFEQTYKKIAHEKAAEAKAAGEHERAAQLEADVQEESMESVEAEDEEDGEEADEQAEENAEN